MNVLEKILEEIKKIKDGNRKEETQCTAYVYLIWMELF